MVRQTLVEVLRQDLSDIDLGFSSITEVEVSPDLHYARVFISGLDEKQAKAAVALLQANRGRARKGLGQRIRLRYTPELEFKYDDTTMRASRIEELLAQIRPARPEEDVTEPDLDPAADAVDDEEESDEHND